MDNSPTHVDPEKTPPQPVRIADIARIHRRIESLERAVDGKVDRSLYDSNMGPLIRNVHNLTMLTAAALAMSALNTVLIVVLLLKGMR